MFQVCTICVIVELPELYVAPLHHANLLIVSLNQVHGKSVTEVFGITSIIINSSTFWSEKSSSASHHSKFSSCTSTSEISSIDWTISSHSLLTVSSFSVSSVTGVSISSWTSDKTFSAVSSSCFSCSISHFSSGSKSGVSSLISGISPSSSTFSTSFSGITSGSTSWA